MIGNTVWKQDGMHLFDITLTNGRKEGKSTHTCIHEYKITTCTGM